MSDDTWIVTSYFNPCRYRTRRKNYDFFRDCLAAIGANVFLVELAGANDAFELPKPEHGLQLRHGSTLWQKERMLNIALEKLPASCTKIVWLDCDLIFENNDWLSQTSKALDTFAVVQPFGESVRLGRDQLPSIAEPSEDPIQESFAAAFSRDPSLSKHAPYVAHGHTGYGWAARRDILAGVGLYDACLTGSGDHLMAHVFAGALESPCIAKMIGGGHAYARHFARWAAAVQAACQGRLGHVPGRVFHLWHGDDANRKYRDHNTAFRRFDFDPVRDLLQGPDGLWEWAEGTEDMQTWAINMLVSRKEDG